MTPSSQHGLTAIQTAFRTAQQAKRAVFIPYYPVGYPDYDTSLDVIRGLFTAGADIVEVGVPFSDPLADGPTIQAATQQALEQGVTPAMCIEAIRTLRSEDINIPMVLMGYLNPFMAYGYPALIADAQAAGIDGFIIPDMPADEAGDFQALVDEAALGIAHFVAPTSSPERIRLAAQFSRGYIYLVSVTGITGARDELPPDLVKHIAAIRTITQTPVAIGFGIGTPDKARAVGQISDGVIVGSALIKAADNGVEAVKDLAIALRRALDAD